MRFAILAVVLASCTTDPPRVIVTVYLPADAGYADTAAVDAPAAPPARDIAQAKTDAQLDVGKDATKPDTAPDTAPDIAKAPDAAATEAEQAACAATGPCANPCIKEFYCTTGTCVIVAMNTCDDGIACTLDKCDDHGFCHHYQGPIPCK